MKKLLVFIGKPGVGKTTLINKVFPGKKVVDVWPFVWSYKVNGRVPEQKTAIAYQDMYRHLADLNDDFVILELGTNHAELNIEMLNELTRKYKIQIYLCVASNETCRQRIQLRNRGDDLEAMERRLARDFPGEHVKLLKKQLIEYQMIDMEQNLDRVQQLILSRLQ